MFYSLPIHTIINNLYPYFVTCPRAAALLSTTSAIVFHTHPVLTFPSFPFWILKSPTARNRHHFRASFALVVSRSKLTMPRRFFAGCRSATVMELIRGFPMRLNVVRSSGVVGGMALENLWRAAADTRAKCGTRMWIVVT